MRCVVPSCKNDSRSDSKSHGITFHSFPVEPTMRRSWLEALGRADWKPKERSSVCSLHFMLEDLYTTQSGLRKVRVGAVPIIQQVSGACDYNTSSTSKVCRMCLVISERLFSIEKCNLTEAFERLTGLSVIEDLSLPQNLCPQCATRLHNYNKFREKTLRINEAMIDLLKNHDNLTQNTLKYIPEDLQTPILCKHISNEYNLILDYTEQDTIDEKDETKTGIDKEIDIKNEPEQPEIFVDDFSTKSESRDYSETSDNTNFTHEFEISENIDNTYTQEVQISENTENTYIKELQISENTDNTQEFDASDKDAVPAFDSDDSLPLEVTRKKKKKREPAKKKGKVKKTAAEKTSRVKKVETTEPKIDRRRKPFLNQDLNETLFTIINLTVEEQIAEVMKRQETDNFKHAVFKCTECFKGFLDQDAYATHMVRHTSACGEHRCEICKTHFKQSHALRKHITAHHLQRFSCNHCPYVTTHRQTARLHERWHKGTKYQCPHCDLEFVKFTTYMGHVRIKHPSDFVCELCGYSFVSAKGIELHKKLKHRGEDATIPEDAPYCEPCNVRFVSSEAHHKHISVSARHSGPDREHNKPTRGRKCREQLEREKLLNKDDDNDEEKRRMYPSQLRRVEGPISCEQCGMELEDSRAYHGHFRRMHPDKNRTNYPSMKSPCMCEVCGRIFQSFALLKDHTWTHTGERPFKCEQCGKSFRMKQRLVAHRRVHSAARTSYSCGVCGKQFSTHSNRQRHMFIHTGLKPYKCEMCGKGFKHASEKRAHVTYVHLKKPWPKRARSKRNEGSPPQTSASEMDMQPVWPACDPKLSDINMMDDKPLYYR